MTCPNKGSWSRSRSSVEGAKEGQVQLRGALLKGHIMRTITTRTKTSTRTTAAARPETWARTMPAKGCKSHRRTTPQTHSRLYKYKYFMIGYLHVSSSSASRIHSQLFVLLSPLLLLLLHTRCRLRRVASRLDWDFDDVTTIEGTPA